jgi:hypothetical protein
VYQKVQTAHDWGYKPSELGICDPEDDLAVMAAYTNTRTRMAAWEEHKREEDRPPPKGKGSR